MSQPQITTGDPACASAVTIPSSGCVGSSGSHQTGTSSAGSGVGLLATTTASMPDAAIAASGYSISLRARGSSKLFTLAGGHLFSLYDGCRAEGVELIDVRHESAAAFAAEGWSKVTRQPGVCALTARPGVTNGMSAIASAHKNNSPMVVLGGRAPQMRWGQGSLQEIDHVPFVRPLTKSAETAFETADIPALLDEALAT